ncbi:MAG: hypothetical protein M3331_07820 [Actinomycetota bacterium]|nr:hypothetical protein [Actinomycetota bacterium]
MERRKHGFPALLGWVGVGLALAIAAAVVALTAGDDMSILGDEWHYAYWMSTDGALAKGFDPEQGRYAIPVPFVVYQGLFEVFGADSYLPFRVTMIFFLALVAGLAYELMRRRVGNLLALAPAALIPLFGSADEVVVNSFRMPGVISLAAALAALLFLERRTAARDVAAGVLLLVAVASHPLGLAFVAAAAILRARSFLLGEARLATLAMVGAPALAFLAVLRPHAGDPEPLTSHLDEVPGFVLDGLRGLFSALGGLVSDGVVPFETLEGFRSPLGLIATILILGVVARTVWQRGWDSAFAVALLLAALIILAAPVFAPGGRPPNLGRYVFPAGVCMLLVLAELGRGLPALLALRSPAALGAGAALAALAALSLVGNTVQLQAGAEKYAEDSRHVRAQAAALDAVRDQDPISDLKIERNKELLGAKYRFSIEVAQYYVVSDDYGTPAWTPRELARQGDNVRRTARLSRQIALGKRR